VAVWRQHETVLDVVVAVWRQHETVLDVVEYVVNGKLICVENEIYEQRM
jgi:hypothetical protein